MSITETVNITPPVIQVSDLAAEKIQQFIKKKLGETAFLRITVDGGGCNGLKYDFKADNNYLSTDFLLSDAQNKPLVAIDPISATALQFFIVDYENSLSRAGFVVKIPSATSRCGCGKSFSLPE